MKDIDIITLEDQSNELIDGVSKIKNELLKQQSMNTTFELESKELVQSLNQVVGEISNLRDVFTSLSDLDIVKLNQELSLHNSEFNATANSIKGENIQFLDKLSDQVTKVEEANQTAQDEVIKRVELLSEKINSYVESQKKVQIELNEKMNKIEELVTKNNEQQDIMMNKVDKTMMWIEENGAIILHNSRCGLFKKKL